MFNLIITVLGDLWMTLNFTGGLEFAAIIVVVMLFSSPSVCGGTLGVGAKLGILSFWKENRKTAKE